MIDKSTTLEDFVAARNTGVARTRAARNTLGAPLGREILLRAAGRRATRVLRAEQN